MILVVDDDSSTLAYIEHALGESGYTVETREDSVAALDRLAEEEPELVICDIMMPVMGGFELKEAYNRRFPNRRTPFIFLSSLSDDDTIVRGLDIGADDYLVKPISPKVLKAKVRAALRRTHRRLASTFHGDLEKLPFINLLKFCELKGLTGDVEINGDEVSGRIKFNAGDLDDSAETEELLGRLYDLGRGAFVIHSRSVDFVEIEEAAISRGEEDPTEAEQPMGRLSGVRVRDRLFQVQTEFVSRPTKCVVTIVTLDGKTVLKKSGDVPGQADREEVERLIRRQHLEVEEEVRRKISAALHEKNRTEETQRTRFNRLFDEGYEKYREQDYAGALAVWEEAGRIDPSNKTLEINMKLVRKKLEGE